MKRLFVILCYLLPSMSALAITPEELSRLSGKGAADKRQVDQQLNLNDLRYEVNIDTRHRSQSSPSKEDIDTKSATTNSAQGKGDPVTLMKDSQAVLGETPQSNKYTKKVSRQEHPQNVRNTRRGDARYQQQRSADVPATNLTSASRRTVFSDAVEPDTKRYYGIRRGTWIKAELRRNINNAEPGDVELYVSQNVHGDKKTLSIDTQLFAAKAFTSATQRLDLLTTYAITPKGREFVLKARIYDLHKVSGLIGIIDANESKIAERGATKGLSAMGSSILGEVSSQSIIAQGFAKGGQSMIQDSQRASQLATRQQITIFVAPQPILLRVEETF
jgi:type IV secretory pathway VirB10-like protein